MAIGKRLEEWPDLVPPEAPPQNQLAVLIGCVDLECRLGDIQADQCDRFGHLLSRYWPFQLAPRLGEREHPCHHAKRKFFELADVKATARKGIVS